MDGIVITEIHLAARIFQSGLWKYFKTTEFKLFMTDFCYEDDIQNQANYQDAVQLVNSGHLKIIQLNDLQTAKVGTLYVKYKPKFLCKTISAIVLAESESLALVSDDNLVREQTIMDFNIPCFNSAWLQKTLVEIIKIENLFQNITTLKRA